jgi:ABC-type branched-subunit amino acid transport system ATPase component
MNSDSDVLPLRSREHSPRRRARASTLLPRVPVLDHAAKANQLVLTLSGGEQQIVALTRGVISRPRLLLIESSWG